MLGSFPEIVISRFAFNSMKESFYHGGTVHSEPAVGREMFWNPKTDISSAPNKTVSAKSLTVVYSTCREEPEIDWFLDSLCPHIHDWEKVEVIIINALVKPFAIRESWKRQKIRSIRETAPKPCVWQGEHRITTHDWWAKCNALNTAVCLCTTDWIAFVDDRSVLMPSWMQAVRDAMAGNYAVCGTYEKRTGMTVKNGIIKNGGIVTGRDNRHGDSSSTLIACNGGWWYGCTNALPLEWILTLNGFPEKCDSVSFEDIITGMLLQNNGFPIKFDSRMKIVEDRSPGRCGTVFKRSSKEKHPHDTNDKTHRILSWAQTAKRSDNPFDVRALRETILNGGSFPIPDPNAEYRDWFDGQNLREM